MKTRSLLILLASSALLGVAHAQVSLTTLTYSQNFDTLPTTTATGAFSATAGTQAAISGLTGWSGVKLSGTGTTAASLIADTGSSTTGGLFSYGPASSSNRALGSLASGSNVMAFGADFQNNTGATITSVTLSLTAEFWRSSTSAQNTLTFGYGFSGGTATSSNYLSSTSLTALSALNVVGPAPVSSNGALDGTLAANQTALTYTFTNLNWAAGTDLYIRWQDANDAGNDAGLAIDNFSLTATAAAVPEPSTYAAIFGSLALMGALLRRRFGQKTA